MCVCVYVHMYVCVCVFPHGSKEENTTTRALTHFVLLLRTEQHICQKVRLPLRNPKLGKRIHPYGDLD